MLQNYSQRAVRAREAAELLGISRSLFYLTASGDPTFPQGAKIGRARVWMVTDLFDWLARKTKKPNRPSAKVIGKG